MGRRDYQRVLLKLNKGINQQADLAEPDQCADARNVWAPNGKVERRPGYLSARASFDLGAAVTTNSDVGIAKGAEGAPTGPVGNTMTLSSLAKGDYWYLGYASAWSVIAPAIATTNSSAAMAKATYWDGSEWRWLRVNEWRARSGTVSYHLEWPNTGTLEAFSYVPPGDWAAKTINSQSRFWIRFEILDTALDSSCTITLPAGSTWVIGTDSSTSAALARGVFSVQFPSEKRYVFVAGVGATLTDLNKYQNIFNSAGLYQYDNFGSSSTTETVVGEPATIAVIPQFREAYVATNHWVRKVLADVPNIGDATAENVVKPPVEHRDFAVGEDAPYDPALINQLGVWPECKYTTFFKGRLWCAGIKDEPYVVRWTAAVPYHRVWPTLSAEPLMEDDRSPITGIAGFGEHLVVFKNDSIWMMVSVGENPATQVESYSPIKVVSGVGCVSQASIRQVRGNLIFLAEDGIYVFDGTPSVRKISDRIQDTIDSIVPSRRPLAVAAHWKTKNCYLLAAAVDGSDPNNMVMVYDYKNDAWWLWDSMEAQAWLEDEAASDDERLYFMNNRGHMFEVGADQADNRTAISSYVLTQRIGMGDNIRRTLRQVEVTGNNKCSALTVSARVNDDVVNETSGSLSFTDSSEAQYGSAVSGTDSFVQDRRRSRRIGFRKQGDYVQVKVAHSVKDETMEISSLDLGFAGGVRR